MTSPASEISIRQLEAKDVRALADVFASILIDAVENGASIGFLLPITRAEALAYWSSVADDVEAGGRLILAAFESEAPVGTVQLGLARMPNGLHRAEVMKLIVHSSMQRRGVGRRLMLAVEELAMRIGRALLLLDTSFGGAAERLYASLGYERLGVVPGYAKNVTGDPHPTVFFFKHLHQAL